MRDKIVEAAAALPGVIAAGAGQHLPRLYTATAADGASSRSAMKRRRRAQPAPSVMRSATDTSRRSAHARWPAVCLRRRISSPAPRRSQWSTSRSCRSSSAAAIRSAVASASNGRASDGSQEPWHEIVGVVPDLGLSVGDPALTAGFYLPVHDEIAVLSWRSGRRPIR